ncbi:MAG: zinc-binding alcohol dehydrogenase family protein [Rhodospirillaceae bacterium]|jgi:NADPH:quinone reductase-like Zn-dependent oxidoreductase|nr:zinc-binding alcohol dehydrogenase family protein [Rhodospirillaceae bacterium]MBT3885226.1 zinc-binding alcohol dehydrogenase family protein [Rhodospirillaceae bacterium]MBT4118365.1 zinc-binding alcohol dehydrogenase family protein [Rhodospirillaceae bacterium]MBT4671322.1 zinc-binding alcohol dehydrogenase family protein [Rhodospirillaceae bacterium]MBT4718977.1 zinc-binding alcohol dehydrogenase family protein [Rhodospirillaceae bacterium]
MKAIRVSEKSASSDELKFELADIDRPAIGEDEALVEIHASGVNPSDVKALLGKMPNLVWPRTPGRDYAGVVVDGPADKIGQEVWGTGGDLGMKRDGNHAQYGTVKIAGLCEKPSNISMNEAGGIGVSWTCAWLGIVDGADVAAGDVVVVLGAAGKVGEASVQIATGAGARVIAVERARSDYAGHASGPVEVIDLRSEPDLTKAILDRTDGKGADIIMNGAGDPYFVAASNALAKQGRQIIISTFTEEVTINLRTFYRGNHRLIGVSNMDHDHIVSAELLSRMRPGFDAGAFKPFPILDGARFGLDGANDAYRMVLQDRTRDRVIIQPQR